MDDDDNYLDPMHMLYLEAIEGELWWWTSDITDKWSESGRGDEVVQILEGDDEC